MPIEAEKYPPGEYRWMPGAYHSTNQVGFIGERDTWFNQFIELGGIEILGA